MSRQPLTLLGGEGEFLVPKSYILPNRRDSLKPCLQKNHQSDILYIKLLSPRFRNSNRRVCCLFFIFWFCLRGLLRSSGCFLVLRKLLSCGYCSVLLQSFLLIFGVRRNTKKLPRLAESACSLPPLPPVFNFRSDCISVTSHVLTWKQRTLTWIYSRQTRLAVIFARWSLSLKSEKNSTGHWCDGY